jgi:hypothetical protein
MEKDGKVKQYFIKPKLLGGVRESRGFGGRYGYHYFVVIDTSFPLYERRVHESGHGAVNKALVLCQFVEREMITWQV